MPAKTVIQHRRDTAANWTSANPVLASAEIGVETDTNKFKIGDGTSSWTSLAYQGSTGSASDSFATIAVSGQDNVVADSSSDTLTLVAGSNVTITTDAASDSITIAATDTNTTYTAGTGLNLSGTEFSNTGVLSVNGDAGVITNVAKTNTANTFNGGAQSIVASATDVVPLTVTGASGQSANLFLVTNSGGSGLARISPNGSIATGGNLAVGSTSITNTNQFQVTATSASQIGAVIRGAASQTANLQEWQDSSGTVHSGVNSNGYLFIGSSGSVGGQLGILAESPGNRGQVIKGAVSQTANLSEWQNSAGTVYSRVRSGGQIGVGPNEIAGTWFAVSSDQPSWNGAVIRAAASQTANLISWQNSSGTELGAVASSGAVKTPALVGSDGATTALMYGNRNFQIGNGMTGINGNSVLGLSNATAPSTDPVGGGILYVDTGALKYKGTSGSAATIVNADGTMYSYTLPAATSTVLGGIELFSDTVQSVAANTVSSTADRTYGIQLNSDGQAVVNVPWSDTNTTYTAGTGLSLTGTEFANTGVLSVNGSSGAITNVAKTDTANTFNGGAQTITASAVDVIPLTIQATSGQTANLLEIKDSSSNIRLRQTATGRLYSTSSITAGSSTENPATFTSIATSSSTIGAIIKAAASQTANIQEWQNSSGTILARVSNIGSIFWGPAGSALGGSSGRLLVITNDAGQPVALFQAAASQTSNILQWQNSSATILGFVNSAGQLSTIVTEPATNATTATSVGYSGIPQGTSTTGSLTLTKSYAGEHVYTTSSRTVTIPANSSVPFEIGTTIVFISGAGATTTIAITSDTMYLAGTGTTGSRTLAAHGMATAVKVASTTWYISGNGLT